MANEGGRNSIAKLVNVVSAAIDAPITWFRETIVTPNQQKYPWYHQKHNRVPTIDQCYTDDPCCIYEANQQFKRDKKVDNEILSILRFRFEDCVVYEAPDHLTKCKDILEVYKRAEENWFAKYGDLGYYGDVRAAFFKQKHRMVWERRHGKIGSGRKDVNKEEEEGH